MRENCGPIYRFKVLMFTVDLLAVIDGALQNRADYPDVRFGHHPDVISGHEVNLDRPSAESRPAECGVEIPLLSVRGLVFPPDQNNEDARAPNTQQLQSETTDHY